MKKIIITICLVVGSISFSKAQGNLQFNKAKFIELAGYPIMNGHWIQWPVDSAIIAVPTNKVWKIENIALSSIDTSWGGQLIASGSCYAFLLLNSVMVVGTANSQAIWLPAGTYKFKLMSLEKTYMAKALISAIEYNIVP